MLILVLSGFALAVVAPWLHRALPRVAAWLLAALPAGLAVYFAVLLQLAATGTVTAESTPWFPEQGIALSFRADGLGALFATIISAVGALVVVYSGGYLRGKALQGRFYAYLLSFMASMLGLALSDNLLSLFVFWELTSVTSYLLIGFHHEDESSRGAALQALLVTELGSLAMLAGFLLLGQAAGTYTISELVVQRDSFQRDEDYLPVLLLILAGAFTKSAQFPFHFWLPNAMTAPTPVSAYLHSATMVKAGIYLLARLSPLLGGTGTWQWLLSVCGGATLLLGAWLALQQDELKRLLAYATVSVLGMLTMLLGNGTVKAVEAFVVLLVAHAGYKGALFLVAGNIDHETGTRALKDLSGLGSSMRISAAVGIVAALSMSGVPPLLGFLSKELSYEAASDRKPLGVLGFGAVVVANVLLVAAAAKVGVRPFLGRQATLPKTPHEAPLSMWLGPSVLALLSVVAGVLPGLASPLLAPAVHATLGYEVDVTLKLWHGFNLTFVLSMLTLLSGAALFAARHRLLALSKPFNALGHWGPERGYSLSLNLLGSLARVQTKLLQSGYLRYYVMVIVGSAALLTAAAFVRGDAFRFSSRFLARPHEVAVALIVLSAAWFTATAKSRLVALAGLAAVGYGVALIFVQFGAPDLAITQFSIETLTLILFLSVVYRLPAISAVPARHARLRDALIAGAAGGLVTLLVLSASSGNGTSRLSQWFGEHSYPLGHGRNVVNVILVDFRSLDTLGEITVLAVAAVGVFSLMKLKLGAERER